MKVPKWIKWTGYICLPFAPILLAILLVVIWMSYPYDIAGEQLALINTIILIIALGVFPLILLFIIYRGQVQKAEKTKENEWDK